eukprot:1625135-Prymnesium_polylepis.1
MKGFGAQPTLNGAGHAVAQSNACIKEMRSREGSARSTRSAAHPFTPEDDSFELAYEGTSPGGSSSFGRTPSHSIGAGP